jgi:hypothetical protein
VRGAQIFVIKLTVNSSVCAVGDSATLPLYRVTKVLRLASIENIL